MHHKKSFSSVKNKSTNYLKASIGILALAVILQIPHGTEAFAGIQKPASTVKAAVQASAGTASDVNKVLNQIKDLFNGLFHNSTDSQIKSNEKKIEDMDKRSKLDDIDFEKRLGALLNGSKRIDTGDRFVKEIINDNDRMKFYDLYIKLAKEKGYIVTSYIDYLQNYMDTDKKVLILRHDIDEKSDGTKMMFDIEKNEGVKATYYFRWKTFDLNLIKQIAAAGFEVGLHYETIATYCIEHHTRKIGPDEIVKCRELLKQEIKDFKKKSGIDIQTIASHGNPVNREINIPNNTLLIGEKYSDYGILSETYDPIILKEYVKSYICDNDLLIKDGFAYNANPIESVMQNAKVIEFLSHPSHWYYTVYQRAKMYLEMEDSSVGDGKKG